MFVDSSKGPHYYGFLVDSDGFANLPIEANLNRELYDYPKNKKV